MVPGLLLSAPQDNKDDVTSKINQGSWNRTIKFIRKYNKSPGQGKRDLLAKWKINIKIEINTYEEHKLPMAQVLVPIDDVPRESGGQEPHDVGEPVGDP